MSLIVSVVRQSFTVGAEIGVMADSALISVTDDVAFDGCAQRTVAVNATMSVLGGMHKLKRSIEGSEAVTIVFGTSRTDAVRAVIEIRAGQALMSDAENALR